jgi:hypothetical protein
MVFLSVRRGLFGKAPELRLVGVLAKASGSLGEPLLERAPSQCESRVNFFFEFRIDIYDDPA